MGNRLSGMKGAATSAKRSSSRKAKASAKKSSPRRSVSRKRRTHSAPPAIFHGTEGMGSMRYFMEPSVFFPPSGRNSSMGGPYLSRAPSEYSVSGNSSSGGPPMPRIHISARHLTRGRTQTRAPRSASSRRRGTPSRGASASISRK
jgi:hypothetical protein